MPSLSRFHLFVCIPPFGRGIRALAVLANLVACKDYSHTDVPNANSPAPERAARVGFYATDAQNIDRNSKLFFQVWNNTFTLRLDDLPMAAQIPEDKMPRSGSYYAELDGGTNQVVNGRQTPLQKYDAAFYGGQNKSSAWENDKHHSNVSWAGHCNGWSAANTRHPQEPYKSVVRGGVTFSPQDIKALMAEVHMNADYEFLGGSRCDNPSLLTPSRRADPTVMDTCEGINPGTIHATVANWIGRMNHAVIANVYPGDQVWNHPIVKYQVFAKNYISKDQAAQYMNWKGQGYVFNPNAAKYVQMSTRLTYIEALRQEVLGQRYTKDIDLNFILELDANGNILGGEWADQNSQQNHPEFLWVPFEPQTPNGTRYVGNQFIDYQTVLRLYAESIGADPNNPPEDIKRPAGDPNWGKWPTFDVVIDGTSTGAAFAGKPINLHVTRHLALDGPGVTLEMVLNGTALAPITSTASEEMSVALNAGPGINLLEFHWKKGAQGVEDESVNFHVMR